MNKRPIFAIALAVLVSEPSQALPTQSSIDDTDPRPSLAVVRRFAVAGLDQQIAYAELIDTKRKLPLTSAADLVAEFVPTFGQAVDIIPMPIDEMRGIAVLFKFRDQKAVATFVEGEIAGSSEHFACRIVMDAYKGKPESRQFLTLNRWCMHAVSLANLDAAAIYPRITRSQ